MVRQAGDAIPSRALQQCIRLSGEQGLHGAEGRDEESCQQTTRGQQGEEDAGACGVHRTRQCLAVPRDLDSQAMRAIEGDRQVLADDREASAAQRHTWLIGVHRPWAAGVAHIAAGLREQIALRVVDRH